MGASLVSLCPNFLRLVRVRPRLGESQALRSGGRGAGSGSLKHLALVAPSFYAAPTLLIVANDLSSLLEERDGPGAESELSLTLAHLVDALIFCDGRGAISGKAKPCGALDPAAAAKTQQTPEL